MHGWFLGHALLQRGIPTARPLAAWEPKGSLWRRDAYLATDWIAGAQNLHLYLWDLATRDPAERARRLRQCAESLGATLGRMHGWHVGHRDLKGCNLVVVEHAERVETLLIDLDGVYLSRQLRPARRARDLARLAASLEAHPWIGRTDRLRFLRAYLAESSTRPRHWKPLWRDITTRSLPILARLRHRRAVA
jgi:tRNA A-37 threonylcarbamoyl transferase component Bud32